MMMGMGGPPAMTATGNAVYVLRGNMLYAFDAKDLRQLAKTELPRPEMPQGFPGGGRPEPRGAE
jgi:hypothetical protein